MRKTHRLMIVLVVAVAAIMLGVGAVSAYADLASDTQPPATTVNVAEGATTWNIGTLTLTANDDEGVAYIYHELDGGIARLYRVPAPALTVDYQVPRHIAGALELLAPGAHTLKFWAQDINGNVEAQQSVRFTVKQDTDAPVTTATGAKDGAWYGRSLTVGLVASDAGSGVAQLGWGWDVAPLMADGSQVDVPIAVDAATLNGPHTLSFQAADVAGNIEAVKTLTINVDTVRPRTAAPYAASVARGRTATLRYKVTDPAPCAGKAAVVIKIKNSAGKVVKTLRIARIGVGVVKTKSFAVPRTWKPGTYRFVVYATDVAGNTQARVGSNRLVVR